MTVVTLSVTRNPKAARSGSGLLRRIPGGQFEWVRPLQRGRREATYELEDGHYVLVYDGSSHKNDRKEWDIVEVANGKATILEGWGVWRENRIWGCVWQGKQGSYAFMAKLASAHANRTASSMSVIEIINQFLDCVIATIQDPNHSHATTVEQTAPATLEVPVEEAARA